MHNQQGREGHVKIRNAVSAVIVALALAASPAVAQDLTGTWELSAEGGRGAQSMALDLTQDGSDLTGTLTMAMGGGRRGGGGGGGGTREIEISDGSVDGSSFTFTMTIEFNGNAFSQVFSGTYEGDTMKGEIEGGRGGGRGGRGGGGPREFTGTRGS